MKVLSVKVERRLKIALEMVEEVLLGMEMFWRFARTLAKEVCRRRRCGEVVWPKVMAMWEKAFSQRV